MVVADRELAASGGRIAELEDWGWSALPEVDVDALPEVDVDAASDLCDRFFRVILCILTLCSLLRNTSRESS